MLPIFINTQVIRKASYALASIHLAFSINSFLIFSAIGFLIQFELISLEKFSLYILPVVYLINVIVGGEPGFEANLWYLMKAPAGDSLMNFFPNPPFHIIPLFPIVMLVFYILYLPYKVKNN